jgi:hypothetical protein
MSNSISPWCLHWGRDGELVQSDRQDLLQSLVLEDNTLARLILTQARQWTADCGPSAVPQQSFYLP